MKLVLLPGMDGTGELFSPFISSLPNTVRPIVVTFPRTETNTYDDLVEIARRALPANEPFAILGESFSGPIATVLAAEGHDQLKALIYSCSFVRNPSKALLALKPLFPLIPTHGVISTSVRNLLLGVDSIKIRKLVGESLSTVSPSVIRNRLAQILEFDATESLREVSVPIFYLRASNDRLVKPRSSDHIAKMNANVRIVEIVGPHLLLQTHPEQCANKISGFLSNINGGPYHGPL